MRKVEFTWCFPGEQLRRQQCITPVSTSVSCGSIQRASKNQLEKKCRDSFFIIMSQHIRIFLFLPAQTKFSNRSKDQKSVAHSFAVSIFRLQKINNELLPSFRRRCFCCCTAPPPPLLLLPPPLLLLCCCAAPFALLLPRYTFFRSDGNFVRKKGIIRLENEVGATQKITPVMCAYEY